jgi:hypothetical protein
MANLSVRILGLPGIVLHNEHLKALELAIRKKVLETCRPIAQTNI